MSFLDDAPYLGRANPHAHEVRNPPSGHCGYLVYLNIGAGRMVIHFLDYSNFKGRGVSWVFTLHFIYTLSVFVFLCKNSSHLYLTGARIRWHGAEGGGM